MDQELTMATVARDDTTEQVGFYQEHHTHDTVIFGTQCTYSILVICMWFGYFPEEFVPDKFHQNDPLRF